MSEQTVSIPNVGEVGVFRLNLVKKPGKSARVKAICDVKIGPVDIKGVKVVEKKGGSFFVGYPSKTRLTKEGKTIFEEIAFPNNDALRAQVERMVLAEFEEKRRTNDAPKAFSESKEEEVTHASV